MEFCCCVTVQLVEFTQKTFMTSRTHWGLDFKAMMFSFIRFWIVSYFNFHKVLAFSTKVEYMCSGWCWDITSSGGQAYFYFPLKDSWRNVNGKLKLLWGFSWNLNSMVFRHFALIQKKLKSILVRLVSCSDKHPKLLSAPFVRTALKLLFIYN